MRTMRLADYFPYSSPNVAFLNIWAICVLNQQADMYLVVQQNCLSGVKEWVSEIAVTDRDFLLE